MDLAPIVLFVFDRPDHTRTTLQALSKNKLANESDLYIYSDGPKLGAEKAQIDKINEVRSIIKEDQWCKHVHIVTNDTNLGLADSIIKGVTEIVNKYEKVIVLEDDIQTSSGFLEYMNNALTVYQDNDKVMHISGYFYPLNISSEEQTFFVNILSCWGWATWKRAWKNYNHNIDDHLLQLQSKIDINNFNINGNADFYRQLVNNKEKVIYSWAVRWYASWLFKGGYSLFPYKTLTKNIGHDGTGVHCITTMAFNSQIASFIKVNKIPVKENKQIRNKINNYYKTIYPTLKQSIMQRIKNKLSSIVRIQLRNLLFFNNPLLSFSNKTINSNVDHKAKLYAPYDIINSTINAYTYVSKNAHISETEIGKFCSIGPNLICGWGIHPLEGISTSPCFYSTKKQNGVSFVDKNTFIERKRIQIGHDVFIGANVTILDGVTINTGAVIGAGSVVSKDVPAYAVVAGSPLKILRYRFNADQIKHLLESEWWNYSENELKRITPYMIDKKNLFQI
jgi:acetyltransferase-like isoleucine patch superfamily enzyme